MTEPHSLAPFVRIVGRGPGRGRPLTLDEAHQAMTLMLREDADPEAVGALLMVLRYRGETPDELAGLSLALRDTLAEWTSPAPGLDWPSYAAGRTRGLPWFLLSARLVAQSGVPVLLHGWNSHQAGIADVRTALAEAGVPRARTFEAAPGLLRTGGIAYVALEDLSPRAHALLRLRDRLGLRSILNTVVRMLNPAGAGAVVQGVFHPGYRNLQQEAATRMGLRNLSIIKGGGGEFERHPGKDILLYGLRETTAFTESFAALTPEHRKLGETNRQPGDLGRLWSGALHDPFATEIVLGTAALALETCQRAAPGAGLAMAQDLWAARCATPPT
ncbi:glycosyl transferase family protein [Pseudoruegeria sp. SK021]|uniref:glycosyl transferase family protein n=1 Tax=Pseudoruegeria sp. SK021 TaxID=1933035 RepID=UPI000A25975E|nr:glycosyl transferase family protein [Pseudoruegeria sp. SK021]OSP56438.1 hypothetical protein BV911_00260 [Pseudoruegeria sp. SK021]